MGTEATPPPNLTQRPGLDWYLHFPCMTLASEPSGSFGVKSPERCGSWG